MKNLLLTGVLALTLVSCGSDDDKNNPADQISPDKSGLFTKLDTAASAQPDTSSLWGVWDLGSSQVDVYNADEYKIGTATQYFRLKMSQNKTAVIARKCVDNQYDLPAYASVDLKWKQVGDNKIEILEDVQDVGTSVIYRDKKYTFTCRLSFLKGEVITLNLKNSNLIITIDSNSIISDKIVDETLLPNSSKTLPKMNTGSSTGTTGPTTPKIEMSDTLRSIQAMRYLNAVRNSIISKEEVDTSDYQGLWFNKYTNVEREILVINKNNKTITNVVICQEGYALAISTYSIVEDKNELSLFKDVMMNIEHTDIHEVEGCKAILRKGDKVEAWDKDIKEDQENYIINWKKANDVVDPSFKLKVSDEADLRTIENSNAKLEKEEKEEKEKKSLEEKTEEKSEEKTEEKSEEKTEEKSEEKTEEKSEEKTEEKSEEKTEEKSESTMIESSTLLVETLD